MSRRLRLGMIGGGRGAFIGAVHRMAARLDDRYELVAGVFSADPQRSRDSGAELLLDPRRCYASVDEMVARGKRAQPIASTSSRSSRRIICITPPRRNFCEAGFHVICDKPMTTTRRRCEPTW